jgi:branched-chain amino acid transport system substrate-binding protein
MRRLITAVFFAMALGNGGAIAQTAADKSCETNGIPDVLYSPLCKKNSIKIGVMFIASGPMGGYGRHGRQAVELAVDEINAKGGINGRKVGFLFEDTELNADRIREIADKYINQDRVDFLMGPTSSGLAVILSDIAKTSKVPLILTQAADASLTGAGFHKYVFGTLSNSMMHSRAGAFIAAELPFTKWMVIGPDYNYGHSSWEMFRDKLRELRPEITVVGELFPPLMSDDFTDYINEIISAAPEAVWAPLWGNDAVLFIQQAMAIDPNLFRRIQFVIPDGASLEVLDPVGPIMPDGILMSSRYYYASPQTTENASFIKAYQNKFGEMPDYMACETYAGVYFIKAAVERARSTNPSRFIAAVEEEPLAWYTPEGWKVMRKSDHQAVEDVLWGWTKYNAGDIRANLTDIRSIQGEMIARTPDELAAINPFPDGRSMLDHFSKELKKFNYSPERHAIFRKGLR